MAYDTQVVTDFEALKASIDALYASGVLRHAQILTDTTVVTVASPHGLGVVTEDVYVSGFVAGETTFTDATTDLEAAGVAAGDILVQTMSTFTGYYRITAVSSGTLTLDVDTPVAYTALVGDTDAMKGYSIVRKEYLCELDDLESQFTTLSLSILSINNQN